MKSALRKIEVEFNKYLREAKGIFHNARFIMRMNALLSSFPDDVVKDYQWKRYGSTSKPTLYLRNINYIIEYDDNDNSYKARIPKDLKFFCNM